MTPAKTPANISLEEHGIAAALTLTVIALTLAFQDPTTLQGGLGWDGAAYHAMAEDVVHGERISGGAPFVYRIGLPVLAAWLSPGDLRLGFLALSVPAMVLTALAFHLLLGRYVASRSVRLLCLALYLGAYHGLPRFIPFRPFMVDGAGTLFLFWGVYLVDRYRTDRKISQLAWVTLLCFVGTLFRESAVLAAGAVLFVDNPLSRRGWDRHFFRSLALSALPLCAFAAATALSHQLVQADHVGDAFKTLVVNALAKKPHTLFVAIFLCFGPIVLAPVFAYRLSARFLWERQHLLALLAGALVLGVAGGSDTERLMYWGAPVVFILVGRLLDEGSLRDHATWLVPLVALQAVAHRWFLTLPQSGEPGGGLPLLTMLGQGVRYEDLWSSHTTRTVRLILAAEYAAVVVGMFLLMRRFRERVSQVPPALSADAAEAAKA